MPGLEDLSRELASALLGPDAQGRTVSRIGAEHLQKALWKRGVYVSVEQAEEIYHGILLDGVVRGLQKGSPLEAVLRPLSVAVETLVIERRVVHRSRRRKK